MKVKVYIRRCWKIGMIISIVAVVWLLAACSTDDSPQETSKNDRIELRSVTRSTMGAAAMGDIQVYITNPEEPTVSGLFEYYGETVADDYGITVRDHWVTQDIKLKAGTRTYNLYGYMPADKAPNSTFENGKLTISGLDLLTTLDVSIITGVNMTNTDPTNQESSGGLPTRGDFSFLYQNTESFTYLNLLFDHLYGRLTFKFKLGEKYSKLRQVTLKTVEVKTVAASKVDAVITLSPFDLSSIAYTVTDDTPQSVTLLNTSTPITTSGEVVGSINLPESNSLKNQFELVSTYEVYDMKNNLLSTRTATNKLSTALPKRGEEEILELLVEPTFLYQLSDDDLDNPTVKL